MTRDRVPLDWAKVRMNQGRTEIVYYDKARDPARLDRAEALVRAGGEVFDAAGAGVYRDQADRLLAAIAARRAR